MRFQCIGSGPRIDKSERSGETLKHEKTNQLRLTASNQTCLSHSFKSSSAEPSYATPAPPSVSSSSSFSIPRGPARYTSRCRRTNSLRLAANTRCLILRILSVETASSMKIVTPFAPMIHMRLRLRCELIADNRA